MILAKINEDFINPLQVIIIKKTKSGITIEISNGDVIFIKSIKELPPIENPTIVQVAEYIDECINFNIKQNKEINFLKCPFQKIEHDEA